MAIFHKTLQHHEDTTEKRDISQEDIEFLKRLQLEYSGHNRNSGSSLLGY